MQETTMDELEKNIERNGDKLVYSTTFEGRPLKIEVGELAKQANGSALVQYGETVVLATATCSKNIRAGLDFFPLMVDVEEKMYAAGKIPGGFIKREGRPTEKAILNARLIDRPIRPLFPDGIRNDIQLVCLVLSADQENSPDMPAMLAASTALSVSGIPFREPIAGVRVSLIDNEYVVNPTFQQLVDSRIDLIVACTARDVMMIEAGANEASEEEILKAIEVGQKKCSELVAIVNEIKEMVGKPPVDLPVHTPDEELAGFIRETFTGKIARFMRIVDKQDRNESLDNIKEEAVEILTQRGGESAERLIKVIGETSDFDTIVKGIKKEELTRMILDENMRPDGRAYNEIRPISTRVSILPRTHGSAVFTRGQTQVLTSLTLAPMSEGQTIDDLTIDELKRYMHQYNFPPFSVGEVRPMRGPGRRDIGHGALAERALIPVIPEEDDFPYAMRMVSEVLESNGSSSMASVCASTMALMDGGVPIKRPVTGVAMGIITRGDQFKVLTDIQGMEDFLGEMDFKVAGTRAGVTAIQMDIKVPGVNLNILRTALEQGKEARYFILDKIHETIEEPRQELSPYAPRIFTMMIDPDKIRLVIGPGGKIINQIIDETGTKIDIENDGTIYIASTNLEMGEKARAMIQEIIREPEVGEVYEGKVVRIADFGAFIEFLPGKDGMIHISDLDVGRVNKVTDVLKVGDSYTVQINEIDGLGRINLKSPDVEKKRALLGESSPDRGDRGGKPPFRGGSRGGGGGRPSRPQRR